MKDVSSFIDSYPRPTIFFVCFDVFEHSFLDLLSKTDNTGSIELGVSSQSDSHFKVVADKRNSLLVGTWSPAVWVNKTAEKEQLATHGEEWRYEA